MPTHLHPTAPLADDAILVGDPGRALLLAQELLQEPRMSNHAWGLWGYSGSTPAHTRRTLQATGIGGPRAALVLGEMAELGTRRAIRIGTCAGFGDGCQIGELLSVSEAIAAGSSGLALEADRSEPVLPSASLTQRLLTELAGTGRPARIASFDTLPAERSSPKGTVAGDMQTAALLARADEIGIEIAALLIVAEVPGKGERLSKQELEGMEKLAGHVAASALTLK
jgi:uridine phosphorylase